MQLNEIETPAVLIDLDIVDANIARAQQHVSKAGFDFRPHIKTHKLPLIAQLQLTAGGRGIACQKLTEAEVFAAAGFDDIMLCFNLLSQSKIERLAKLAAQQRITTLADNAAVVAALSSVFASHKPIEVLVECDTGMGRCGVVSPDQAADLAAKIDAAPGLKFGGLMTYPKPDSEPAVQEFLAAAKALCLDTVGHCNTVTGGGSPSFAKAASTPILTEYRAGTYVYNDRSLVQAGACGWDDCALSVLATVVSRPVAERAVMDAGSKSLTSDLLGMDGYGVVRGRPDVVIAGLSEEHGHLQVPADDRLQVGEKIQVIPNHACPVSNLVDSVYLHRSGKIIGQEPVAARGCVT